MPDYRMGYWCEVLDESLLENGVVATEEQVKLVAHDMKDAHENVDVAFGHHWIPNPLFVEERRQHRNYVEELKQKDKEILAYKIEACTLAHKNLKDVYYHASNDAIYCA